MPRRITWPFRRSRRPNATQEAIDEDELFHGQSDTLEDIGLLLVEQARCLDEVTNRSNILAAENIDLRERISSGIDSVSKSRRVPLSSIINNKNRKGSTDMLEKFKDENEMLLQQADLLAKELNDAHSSIAERDSSIASLSHELSGMLEKVRALSEYNLI